MNDPSPPSRAPALILIAVLSALSLGAAFYFRPAPDESDPSLQDTGPSVAVHREMLGVFFMPVSASGVGLIFYPGARIPPEAYSWLGAGLAAKGHPVFIARFPFNFPQFAASRAMAIEKAHPEIGPWAIGGHAQGGSMAAAFAHDHPAAVSSLILMAAAPDRSANLSSSGLPVLQISATEDGLETEAKMRASLSLLPPDARRVVIQGGNHAHFGEYGEEKGDRPSTIGGDRQRAMTLDAILGFLGGGGG
ncbi:MAG TPA: alpha/beta hydrolase [Rectinemataceae bacterium]|nr:alpha/beta hydrolase [Rectinemataceae bacterium]